jgi:ethanolaminephosphotransferase
MYRYAGGDNGFAYIYFYNPAATKIVEYLPNSLAPNMITLVGFAFSAIPAIILFSCFGTNLYNDGEEIPRWWFFLQGFSYFMYRMLDEMDGK